MINSAAFPYMFIYVELKYKKTQLTQGTAILDFIEPAIAPFDPATPKPLPKPNMEFGLVVWLSGNALVVINEVTLRQARLIQGWVTVCGQVNHLGM